MNGKLPFPGLIFLERNDNFRKRCITIDVHPQYINDTEGNRTLVVLPVQEFETLMEELEELEDIRLFDEAKKRTRANACSFPII